MMLHIRVDPEDGGRIAIATGNKPDLPWFIFHTNRGGYYSKGEREKVNEWTELVYQEDE